MCEYVYIGGFYYSKAYKSLILCAAKFCMRKGGDAAKRVGAADTGVGYSGSNGNVHEIH